MPHSRTSIMREHFESLGNEGMFGPRIMSMILSTQVSFDFTSPVDLAEKLRVQAAASTPAAALFVNAPMDGGEPCGALSRRMQFWSRADPAAPASSRSPSGRLHHRPLHRVGTDAADGAQGTAGRKQATGDSRPLRHSAGEGLRRRHEPDLQDWRDHLSQIFPDVRLRDTLELRAVDGPPYPALGAVPAFWSGLTHDAAARASVWELLRGISPEQHLQGLDDIAVRGMDAQLAGRPMRDLAAELLRLSESGLRAQIAAGREREEAAAYLEPLKEVVRAGETFADRVLALWHSKPEHFPRRTSTRSGSA